MQIPEEFRCSVCLSAKQDVLLVDCPHKLCADCAIDGSLDACPICRSPLPAERPRDSDFAAWALAKCLPCECGVQVALLDADEHECEHVKRQRLPFESARGSCALAPVGPNRSTFACPLCSERNLTSTGLVEHFEQKHAQGKVSAVCPICLSMPWGDPSIVSQDFRSHLKLRHRCDYATLTDFEMDEEAMMRRAIEESLQTNGNSIITDADEDAILLQVLQESARETEEDFALSQALHASVLDAGAAIAAEQPRRSEGPLESQEAEAEDDDITDEEEEGDDEDEAAQAVGVYGAERTSWAGASESSQGEPGAEDVAQMVGIDDGADDGCSMLRDSFSDVSFASALEEPTEGQDGEDRPGEMSRPCCVDAGVALQAVA